MTDMKITNTTLNFWAVVVSTIILLMAIGSMYGSLDTRVTVLETEIPHKISAKELFERMTKMEEKLIKKIEEINK